MGGVSINTVVCRAIEVAGVVNYIYCRPGAGETLPTGLVPSFPPPSLWQQRSVFKVLTISYHPLPCPPPRRHPISLLYPSLHFHLNSPCVLIQSSESQLPVCRIFCQLVKLQFCFCGISRLTVLVVLLDYISFL